MNEDSEMQDVATEVPGVSQSPNSPPNGGPAIIRLETKTEKKMRELDNWKLELASSEADCQRITARYHEISNLAREASAEFEANPGIGLDERRAGVAEVQARKKSIMEELQAARDAVTMSQTFVKDLTDELANLQEESASVDVWQDDRSVTSAATRSKSGLYACTPDANNPWHADIVRCLKEKMVPLDSSTRKIDFGGLVPKVFPNAPSLEDVVKKKDGESALLIVQGIHRFLSEFEEFYKTHLGRLFPILASGYMAAAFREVGLQTSLLKDPLVSWGSDLPTQMSHLQAEGNDHEYRYDLIDTWLPVKMAVKELFKVELLKAGAIKSLFGLSTGSFSDLHAYCTRVELLVEASGLRGSEHEKLVVESLYAGLPDEGQRAVTTAWPDVKRVPGVEALLECVRNARVPFPGTRTNWVDWFYMRFKTLSNKKNGAQTVEKDNVPDSRTSKKRPRKDNVSAVKDSDDRSRKSVCTPTQCNSKFHHASKCFAMHPELRNAPKRSKPHSSGPGRSTASMRLEPIDSVKVAAMKSSMNELRSNSLAGRLEDDMNSLSFNTVSDFSQCLAELDRGEPTKYLCAFRGPAEGETLNVTKN